MVCTTVVRSLQLRLFTQLFRFVLCTVFVSYTYAETHPGHRAQHTTPLWNRNKQDANHSFTKASAVSLVSDETSFVRYKRRKPKNLKLTQLQNEVTEYIGKIGVGTSSDGEDSQAEVRVVFDTGSTNLWVASTLCKTSPCTEPGRSRFNSEDSKTYSKPAVGEFPLDIKFGTGELSGPLGMDTLRFGAFKVRNQTFAQIQKESGQVFVEIPFEGILGLAFPSMSAMHVTPFFDNVIQQGVLKKNEFAFYLNQHDDRPSALLWGGVDPALYVGDIQMFPVTQPHYWSLDLIDFKIGNKSYGEFSTPLFGGLVEGKKKRVKKLIVDSGTTYFTAPSGLKSIIAARLPSAPCSEVEKQPEKYPDITFVLRNAEKKEFELTVGQMTYMVEETTGSCVPGFMTINVKKGFGPAMILGELFMRHHFTVFSRGETDADARIGFANARLGSIPTALREEEEQETAVPESKASPVDEYPHFTSQKLPLPILGEGWVDGMHTATTQPPFFDAMGLHNTWRSSPIAPDQSSRAADAPMTTAQSDWGVDAASPFTPVPLALDMVGTPLPTLNARSSSSVESEAAGAASFVEESMANPPMSPRTMRRHATISALGPQLLRSNLIRRGDM